MSDVLDPVTQEILTNALYGIAEEMALVEYRSSFSPIIREMLDFNCGVFDAEGRMVAHSEQIPAQLGLMQFALQAALERHGPLAPGDAVLTNHPYMGGTHTPDLQVLLLERADHPGFWQSVTGSQDEGETLRQTAAREVAEETGLDAEAFELTDWNMRNEYEIYPEWRWRYAPAAPAHRASGRRFGEPAACSRRSWPRAAWSSRSRRSSARTR